MENNGSGRVLVNELIQGRDVAKKLQSILLKELPSSSSNGTCELMMQNIVASFEKAIGILQSDLMYQPASQRNAFIGTADSPNSFSGSPKSQDSDGDSKDPEHLRSNEFKKRKLVIPHDTKRVQGCSSTGLEGPVEDGCSWRKYGQKDILGAKYPRAYYRCTLRQVQGCLATKQVQRCDDDPTFFNVTYRGTHRCSQAASSSPLLTPSSADIKPEPPAETPTHHQQSPQNQIMWSFTDQQEDIKPFNNNKLLKTTFSFASSLASTQNAPTTAACYNDIDPTNYIGNSSTNVAAYGQQSFASHTQVHSPAAAMASEFSFGQGEEFHQDIMFDSPKLFP